MDCPSCQKSVQVTEAQYGALFTCPSCQAVYFINFDGNAEYETAPQPTTQDEVRTAVHSAKQMNQSFGQTPSHQSIDQSFGQPTAVKAEPDILSMNNLYQTPDETTGATLVQPSQAMQTPLQSAISDIENFGNQDVDVNLTFNLTIQGLDSRDTVNQFYESINDSKFGWVVEDIMKSISKGQCEIKKIKPVSAHVLAKRLQFLDVTLEWSFENAI